MPTATGCQIRTDALPNCRAADPRRLRSSHPDRELAHRCRNDHGSGPCRTLFEPGRPLDEDPAPGRSSANTEATDPRTSETGPASPHGRRARFATRRLRRRHDDRPPCGFVRSSRHDRVVATRSRGSRKADRRRQPQDRGSSLALCRRVVAGEDRCGLRRERGDGAPSVDGRRCHATSPARMGLT